MGFTAQEKKAHVLFLQDLLQQAEKKRKIVAAAQEARPGTPARDAILSKEQFVWAKGYVVKEFWRELESAEKSAYLERALPSQAAAAEPSSSSRKRAADGEEVTMGRPKKALADNQVRQRVREARGIEDMLVNLRSEDDVAAVVTGALQSMEKKGWVGVAQKIEEKLRLQRKHQKGYQSKCSDCEKLLSGLWSCPKMQTTNLRGPAEEIRNSLDVLVQNVFPERSVARDLGYKIGRQRWSKASAGDSSLGQQRQQGRPSVKDNPDMIAAVREALKKHSQAGSAPCKNSAGEWVPAVSLTKPWGDIYHDTQDWRELRFK